MLAFFTSSAQVDLLDIVALCAGLGVFLMGMKLMSDSMEKFANNKLRNLLNSVTNNKLKGVGVGAAVTAIIQSSSATTVMTVGLVNAGVLTLVQSVPIIMGANIGTTITAQIAALQSVGDVTTYLELLAVIGAFMALLGRRERTKTIGVILAGLGLLFVGLDIMSGSMADMKDSPFFSETIQTITNPFLLVLIGLVFTGIIQSSSAVTGILVSMAASGIVIGGGGNAVLYVILGTNIGTCVTALLSGIGANTNGKRAAVVHLLFNVIGTIVFMILLLCWPSFYDVTLAVWFEGVPATQIAMFHTFFNVVTTLLLLPFANALVKLSKIIVKSKKTDKEKVCQFIDDRFLEMPSIAISQAEKEIASAIGVAKSALDIAVDSFVGKNNDRLAELEQLRVNLLRSSASITKFLIKVSSEQISYSDEKTLSALHHILTDIDRLAELAENIRRYSQVSQERGLEFSQSVMGEISEMHSKLSDQFAAVLTSVENWNGDLLPQIEERENQIDECKKALLDSHIKRLNDGECKIESSSVFINLVGNLERVGDHLAKIARSVAQ